MLVNGTQTAYFFTFHRKLWLFGHSINMGHTSDLIAEGRLIVETSYQQKAGKYTEVASPGGKIDFYDPQNETVHEVKKSSKVKKAMLHKLNITFICWKRRVLKKMLLEIDLAITAEVRELIFDAREDESKKVALLAALTAHDIPEA